MAGPCRRLAPPDRLDLPFDALSVQTVAIAIAGISPRCASSGYGALGTARRTRSPRCAAFLRDALLTSPNASACRVTPRPRLPNAFSTTDSSAILMNAPRRRMVHRCVTANPTARSRIWPKTSRPSLPWRTACARKASRHRRSTRPISSTAFLLLEDFGTELSSPVNHPRRSRNAMRERSPICWRPTLMQDTADNLARVRGARRARNPALRSRCLP